MADHNTVGQGWHGVDLDGTLAFYDGWKGAGHIGEPIKPVVEMVKDKLRSGEQVKIFTARVCSAQDPELREKARYAIELWCLKHIGVKLPVTCEKDYSMISLWDDRCVQVVPNSGVTLMEILDSYK